MADFSSNDEFYEFVDRFAVRLADAGREAHARKLRTLLHEVAWTTSSEFLGELGQEFLNLEAIAQELPVLIPSSAKSLDRIRIDRADIVGSIDPMNPAYINKVGQIGVDGIADGSPH